VNPVPDNYLMKPVPAYQNFFHSSMVKVSSISHVDLPFNYLPRNQTDFTFNLPLDVVRIVVNHFPLVFLVHPEQRGGRVVPGPERDEVVLHEGKDLGVELVVAGEHLEGLVHQAVNVGQVLDGDVTLALGLKLVWYSKVNRIIGS
jgi:hypothetical protein